MLVFLFEIDPGPKLASPLRSTEYHRVLLVNQVFVEGPRNYATHTFTGDSRHQPSEVTWEPFCLVYFHKGVCDSTIVLPLVFIMVLKVRSRSDKVQWVSNRAAKRIGCERCGRGDYHQVACSIMLILLLSIVEPKHHHEIQLEEVVNGVEDA